MTVVAKNSPSNQYAEWFYTKGRTNGRLAFQGLPAGAYEARAYFNWPSGGYVVQARAGFELAPGSYEGRGYFDWPAGGFDVRATQTFRVVENRTPLEATGLCANPKVLAAMDRWLATAIPVDGHATSRRRFDAWGNVDGSEAAGRPSKTKPRRCAHLWKVAAQLKSSNQGTLKEFVEKNH